MAKAAAAAPSAASRPQGGADRPADRDHSQGDGGEGGVEGPEQHFEMVAL